MISVKKKELFTLLYFFGSLLWWRLANFYMFYNMKRIQFFFLIKIQCIFLIVKYIYRNYKRKPTALAVG